VLTQSTPESSERGDRTGARGNSGGQTSFRPAFDIVLPIVFAVCYAVIALWVHFKWFPIGDTGVESDFYQTLAGAAQELWDGHLSVASHPTKGPFYSVALVFIHMFGGDWYTNAVVLNVLCAAGSILVLYRLLLRVFGRWLAVAATLSVSLVSEFFAQAHKASSDRLFFLLCFLAIGSLLSRRRFRLQTALAGAFSALAFLTRYNGLYLPVAAVFVVLFVNPRGWRRRRRYVTAAIYVAVFALVCAPWFLLNLAETGTLVPTRNVRNITETFYGGVAAEAIPE
jgi:predicted branched-subunit amino acid permease